jgi:hypothetical protein
MKKVREDLFLAARFGLRGLLLWCMAWLVFDSTVSWLFSRLIFGVFLWLGVYVSGGALVVLDV